MLLPSFQMSAPTRDIDFLMEKRQTPSTPFLAVPIGKHLYGGRSITEALQVGILEVFLPWWWFFQSPFGNPNLGGRKFLLWGDDVTWNPFCGWTRGFSLNSWYWAGLWISYLLAFPVRIFAFFLLILRSFLYAPYYLLARELVYLPRKRQQLRRIEQNGRRVVGKISVERHGVKEIVFHAPSMPGNVDDDPTSSSPLCEYIYVFRNSESEIRDLLGRDGPDAITIGEEFPLIVYPYEERTVIDMVVSCLLGLRLHYQVWTEKMLAEEWSAKCADCYPWSRLIFFVVVGAVPVAIGLHYFQKYGSFIRFLECSPPPLRVLFCSGTECTFRDVSFSCVKAVFFTWFLLGSLCQFKSLAYWDPRLIASVRK